MTMHMERAAPGAPEAARESTQCADNSTTPLAQQQRLPLRVTIFESDTGALSKVYGWSDGGLKKRSAPPLYRGSAESTEIGGLRDLATLLDALPAQQAIALCNARRDRQVLVREREVATINGAIARTLPNFGWDSNASALMLFDVDVQGYTPSQVVEIIRGLDPAFTKAAGVGRYSTSSYIEGPEGFTTGAKGVHVFVPVVHPECMREVGIILANRLWLAELGHIFLSKCGGLLVRQLIDATVWSPERLIYEASPTLSGGLTQNRPPAEMSMGEAVDLSRAIPLTADEEAEYQRLVASAKADKLPEAWQVFDAYLRAKAHELGVDVEALRNQWQALGPDKSGAAELVLPPNFPVDLGKHGQMPVSEVVAYLDGGGRIVGHFPDPIEGADYNRTCAYVQPEATHAGNWRIYSHAHGGIVYLLGRPMAFVGDDADVSNNGSNPPSEIRQLAALVREKIELLEADAGALFDSADARTALREIRRVDRGEYARLRKEVLAKHAFKAEEFEEWLGGTDGANDGENAAENPDGSENRDRVMALVELVKKNATLCYQDEGTGVIIVHDEGKRRVHLVPSPGLGLWLHRLSYSRFHRSISDITVATVMQTVLAACIASERRVQTHIRVALGDDGAYYIDLGDEAGRAVRVIAGAWSVITEPSVFFIRPHDALPLPEPLPLPDWKTALVNQFVDHLNFAKNETIEDKFGNQKILPSRDWLLVVTYTLDAFRPDTPFTVLEIDGEQGSAKSIMQRRIRDVIDPHRVPLRGRPKNVEDIFVAAANNHVVSFENISSLTAEQQDALCTLSTGGGHACRALYTNGEEFSISAKRPVILNGIGAAATRPDLIDRVVHIELPTIDDTKRKTEQELNAAWASSHQIAFSAIVQCFAETLAKLPHVSLARRPRMVDFTELGEAVVAALGGPPGAFLKVVERNRARGHDRVIDMFPVGAAVLDLMDRQPAGFNGTVGDFFSKLHFGFGGQEGVPRNARHMGAQLKRIAPALKSRGVIVTRGGHTKAGNLISVRLATPPSGPTVSPTASSISGPTGPVPQPSPAPQSAR